MPRMTAGFRERAGADKYLASRNLATGGFAGCCIRKGYIPGEEPVHPSLPSRLLRLLCGRILLPPNHRGSRPPTGASGHDRLDRRRSKPPRKKTFDSPERATRPSLARQLLESFCRRPMVTNGPAQATWTRTTGR
jgi:hypothetical protein